MLSFTKKKGALQTRRPDRVMMKDGQVVVVDFKFEKKKTSNTINRLKGTCSYLLRWDIKNITGYLWYVDEGLIVKVK